MVDTDTTRQSIILGALLHDIGKFVQRAQKNPKDHDHPHWGFKWFQDNLREKPKLAAVFSDKELATIDSAILSHHDSVDYISLMERIPRGNEEEGDPFSDRLISIFSRASISDKQGKDKYHKLAKLGKENLQESFPVDDKNYSIN